MRRGGLPLRVIFLCLWLVASCLPNTECLVDQVMRSFLRQRRRLWSQATTAASRPSPDLLPPYVGLRFASAHNPNDISAKSYFERHSRLFGVSTVSSQFSSSSHLGSDMTMGSDDGEQQHSDYEKWVRRLYMTNMFHPVKMGLSNMQQLHDLMGNPMDDVSIMDCVQSSTMSVTLPHSHK